MTRAARDPEGGFPVELVPIDDLRPHPRNYRKHPEDQIEHLVASLREHTFYRNVVIARDGTILAGHGIVEASRRAGIVEVPCRRVPIEPDSPQALKILTGDNELGHLAEIDDRMLTDLLFEIDEIDPEGLGLLGTGFTHEMLASLVFVTRPAEEIASHDAAKEWVGMPDYDESGNEAGFKVVVSIPSEELREQFLELIGIKVVHKKTRGTISVRWPPHEDREDLSSLRFDDRPEDPDATE